MVLCMEDRHAVRGCGLIEELVVGVLKLWWVTLNNPVSFKATWFSTLHQLPCSSIVKSVAKFTPYFLTVLFISLSFNVKYRWLQHIVLNDQIKKLQRWFSWSIPISTKDNGSICSRGYTMHLPMCACYDWATTQLNHEACQVLQVHRTSSWPTCCMESCQLVWFLEIWHETSICEFVCPPTDSQPRVAAGTELDGDLGPPTAKAVHSLWIGVPSPVLVACEHWACND